VPIGTSKHAGIADVAADADELHAGGIRSSPPDFIQSTPLAEDDGDEEERLDVVDHVGLAHRPPPSCPGKAACCAARPALPSIASSSALSSPQM
jgi:hypothetical protein